jgi:hypothetical protein
MASQIWRKPLAMSPDSSLKLQCHIAKHVSSFFQNGSLSFQFQFILHSFDP